MADEKPITTSEAARRLGVHRDTVARWIRLGDLPAMRTPRGQYRLDPQVIERMRRQMQDLPP
jgi:excisionase family DNA binding protein